MHNKETKHMKKIINALRNYIIDSILLILFGLVMIIWPNYSLKIIFSFIGLGLIIMGLVKEILFFSENSKNNRRILDPIVGVIQLGVGIFLNVKSEFFASRFPLVAIGLLAYGAVLMLIRAVRIRKGNEKSFLISLVMGIITLVLAVIIFLNPAFIAGIIMQMTGVFLAFEGIALLVVMSLKNKD